MSIQFFISVMLLRTICGQDKNNFDSNHNKNLNLDVNETMVYFYDFPNNYSSRYKVNDAFDGLSTYNWNKTRKIIFYVMGYKANITWSSSDTIRNTFRNMSNVYLMMVDYSTLRHKGGKSRMFENSIMHSYYVGKALGILLTRLHAVGIPSRNIHCIGSSLGAQILGYAGEVYKKETGEKIWRMTGIDPAGPCFSNSDIENQLRSGLADYVEVYHCNAGMLGTSSVLGDIDVFLNDGRTQPNCRIGPDIGERQSAQCSHQSCPSFWARSVESGWLALACDSYENFVTGQCAGNKETPVGYFSPGNVTGVFYVTTESYSTKNE